MLLSNKMTKSQLTEFTHVADMQLSIDILKFTDTVLKDTQKYFTAHRTDSKLPFTRDVRDYSFRTSCISLSVSPLVWMFLPYNMFC